MSASVVIGHKKPRENHLFWFYDIKRLFWRYMKHSYQNCLGFKASHCHQSPLLTLLQLNLGTFSLRYLAACYPPIPPSKNGRYQRTPETNCFLKISYLVTVVVIYFELGHQWILSEKTKCQKTSYWGASVTRTSKQQYVRYAQQQLCTCITLFL